MKYSDFVKEQMMKLKSSNMKASEKMKHIATEWHKTKGTIKSDKVIVKSDKNIPKKETNELFELLGIEGKMTKAKPKSKAALKKQFNVVEKMLVSQEKAHDKPTHEALAHKIQNDEQKSKEHNKQNLFGGAIGF